MTGKAISEFDFDNKGMVYYTYSTTGKPSALYRQQMKKWNGTPVASGKEQQITFLNQQLEDEKNISIASPERALLLLAPSLVAIGKLLRPAVVGLDHVANWFIRLAGMEPKAEIAATYTIEEVASIIQLSTEAGKLQDDLGLLTGTLEFTEETAGSLMVPTNKLVTLEEPVTAEVVETMVAKTGFSRFPVTNHEQQIIGYVHLKDVLVYEGEEERTKPIEPWRIRKLGEVGFDEEAEPVLRQMQEQATHMIGVVKDQTLVGVLFLEDLLEELVGQVSDSLQRQAHLYDPNAQ